MSFVEIMSSYFRSERLAALYFILPVGLALALGALALLKTDRAAVSWGAGVPALLFGLAFVATGLGVGLRTPAQIEALTAQHAAAPAELIKVELPRMEKVNKNFHTTHYAFGVAALVGLALIYGLGKDWAFGLGAVLVLTAGIGFLIDGFAERRAAPYTAALQALAAQQNQAER